MKSSLSRQRFISPLQRKNGTGWETDARTNSTFDDGPLAGEFRSFSKSFGQGQKLDLFQVKDVCARCQKLGTLNIVSLCGPCAQEEQEEIPSYADAEMMNEFLGLMITIHEEQNPTSHEERAELNQSVYY